jgi:hypothetical protein
MPHSTPQPSALKVCSKCGESKPLSEFYFHKTGRLKGRPYAHCCQCAKRAAADDRAQKKDAINAAYREKWASDHEFRKRKQEQTRNWHKNNPERSTEIARRFREERPGIHTFYTRQYRAMFPERASAHAAVFQEVSSGRFPPAWTQVCERCQEAQARAYHHYRGYEPEFRLDVIALCHECHGKEHRVN